MNNFSESEDKLSKIEQEAIDWLVLLDDDEPITKIQKQQLTHWLSQSPDHVKELTRLNQFWKNNILTELNIPTVQQTQANEHQASWFNRKAMLAFSFVLVCFAPVFMYLFNQQPVAETSNGVYITAVGQNKTHTMSDGSTIDLNTNTKILVNYTASNRNIRLLNGEAHFSVAKDSSRPFNVFTPKGRVQAVGTAFNIDLNQSLLGVLVTEGKISVAKHTGIASLQNSADEFLPPQNIDLLGYMTAGQAITIDTTKSTDELKADMQNSMQSLNQDELNKRQAWVAGNIVFSGEPLSAVVAQLNRYTEHNIVITDPSISNLHIGGRFKLNEIDKIFSALEQDFGLAVNKNGNNIYIGRLK